MTGPEMLSWLRAAITGRKAAAEKALPGPWHIDRDPLRGLTIADEAGLVITWTPEYYKRGDADAMHIAANDPRDVIARCEADLGILDLHAIVWRDIGWPDEDGGEESAEIPVCGYCVPKHSHFRSRADIPEGPCTTVRLVAAGYRHQPGYAEAGWSA